MQLSSLTVSVDKQEVQQSHAARCFVSLNISLSHSRSLKVIENGTI